MHLSTKLKAVLLLKNFQASIDTKVSYKIESWPAKFIKEAILSRA